MAVHSHVHFTDKAQIIHGVPFGAVEALCGKATSSPSLSARRFERDLDHPRVCSVCAARFRDGPR